MEEKLTHRPPWCMYPCEDKELSTVMGCWGVMHGNVEKEGEDYCKTCEFYKKEKQ